MTSVPISDDTGVSPVVGVVLLVAVTVILSAVVGAFVFDLGQQSSTPEKSLSVQFSETPLSAEVQFLTQTDATVYIRYRGETIRSLDGVDTGEIVPVFAAPGEDITVATNESVVTTYTVSHSERIVGYWYLDKPTVSGLTNGEIARDASHNRNQGEINDGGDGSILMESSSPIGDSFGLDGQNDYVQVPYNQSLSMDDEFTVSTWVKLKEDSSKDFILSQHKWVDPDGDGVNNLKGFWWTVRPNQRHKLEIGNGSAEDFVAGGTVPYRTWTHIAAVYNGTHVNLYTNGTLSISSTIDSGFKQFENELYIATFRSTTSNPVNGSIDEPVVFNRALQSHEISTICKSNSLDDYSCGN